MHSLIIVPDPHSGSMWNKHDKTPNTELLPEERKNQGTCPKFQLLGALLKALVFDSLVSEH